MSSIFPAHGGLFDHFDRQEVSDLMRGIFARVKPQRTALTGADSREELSATDPAPEASELTAGEVLVPPQPLPLAPGAGASAAVAASQLVGQVSRSLGLALQQRINWEEPVPIDGAAIRKLLASKALKGRSGLHWDLQTDPSARRVLMVVRSGAQVLDAAPVLDLDRVPGGMFVVQLDPQDRMDVYVDRAHKRFNADGVHEGPFWVPGRLADRLQRPKPLRGLPRHQRIMLTGHGFNPKPDAFKPHAIQDIGGKSVRETADRLVALGLEKSHRGTMHLLSCHSGSVGDDGDSFASRLMVELAARGYRDLKVAGLPGTAVLASNGHVWSTVSRLTEDWQMRMRDALSETALLTIGLHRVKDKAATLPADEARALLAHYVPGFEKRIARNIVQMSAFKALGMVLQVERRQRQATLSTFQVASDIAGVRDGWGRLGPGSHPGRRAVRPPAAGPSKPLPSAPLPPTPVQPGPVPGPVAVPVMPEVPPSV